LRLISALIAAVWSISMASAMLSTAAKFFIASFFTTSPFEREYYDKSFLFRWEKIKEIFLLNQVNFPTKYSRYCYRLPQESISFCSLFMLTDYSQ
jgi:hypothetical protein